MRLRFVAVGLLGTTLALSCSTTPPVADAGVGEAGGPCTTSADCPSGTVCEYPGDGGCSATLRCVEDPPPGGCTGTFACACDGTEVVVCGGSGKPVRSFGSCDAGTAGCSSGLACERCDASGYVPLRMGAPATSHGACTPQELQDFVTACVGSTATRAACDAWNAADAGACAACVAPVLESATSWGPFDCPRSRLPCRANSGGCVDLVLKSTADERVHGGAGSCGDAVTATSGCEDYACGACGAGDLPSCDESAVTGECASFVAEVTSATGPCAAAHGDAAPPAVSRCFPQSDADEVAFVDVFCGTGP